MGNRLSKIVTKTGDDGTTGVSGQVRVSKTCPLIQAIGDVDELNSFIGLLLTEELSDEEPFILTNIQHDLFDVGADLSTLYLEIEREYHVTQNHIDRLERLIDTYNNSLKPLKEFVLPGGTRAASIAHIARAVCRRAERSVIELSSQTVIFNKLLSVYLNRLSDFLFVLARFLNTSSLVGNKDVLWQQRKNG